jgi:hypothetical protein
LQSVVCQMQSVNCSNPFPRQGHSLKLSRFIKAIFLYFAFILLFNPSVCTAETFIYIDDKPVLWIYPQDPVYQAWYKHADLIKLAKQMESDGKEQLTLFTKTALTQMAILYEQEAVKSSREDVSTLRQDIKKNRWRHTALEYAKQLRQVSDQINLSSEIVLYIEEYGEPTIVVDGKPYILTTPDLKKSGLLYTAIVEQLCRREICGQDLKKQDSDKDKIRIVINAEWKISETGNPEYYSEDGLHFVFNDIKDRKKKQEISLRLMRELRLISDSLIEISNKNISIDWDVLRLEHISGTYGYKLIINQFGDSLAVELVYLGQIDNLLTETISWMQSRLQDETYQLSFNQADELILKFIN